MKKAWKKIDVVAHRGASGIAPENTLVAFRMAMELGADGIELDVHLSRDGISVVIHDETVDRTGTGTGTVRDMKWSELMKLDFGVKMNPSFLREKMPKLTDVLDLLKDWPGFLNIEIKNDVLSYDGIEEIVVKQIKDYKRVDRTMISSFHHETLKKCHTLLPELELAALLGKNEVPDVKQLKEYGVCAIHPDVRSVTKEKVASWHAEGFAVRPYTVNSALLMRWLRRCGVDAVFTNYPSLGKQILSKAKHKP